MEQQNTINFNDNQLNSSKHQPALSTASDSQKSMKRKLIRKKKKSPKLTHIQKQPVFQSHHYQHPITYSHQSNKKIREVQPYLQQIRLHLKNREDEFYSSLSAKIQQRGTCGGSEVTKDMRTILMKWIIAIIEKFRFGEETLHLCVQLIDYVLVHENSKINKTNLQLLGVSSLFMASKYYQILIPHSQNFVLICGGGNTTKELYEMESYIYRLINFKLQFPSICEFIGPHLLDSSLSVQFKRKVNLMSRLVLMDFDLINKFKKQHLTGTILHYCARLAKMSKFSGEEMMSKMQIKQQCFKSCFQMIENLHKKHFY